MSEDNFKISESLNNFGSIYVSKLLRILEQLGQLFSNFIKSEGDVEVYVDPVNGRESATGSKSDPCNTLQSAMAILQRYRTGGAISFVINLNPGIYTVWYGTYDGKTHESSYALFHIDSSNEYPLKVQRTPNAEAIVIKLTGDNISDYVGKTYPMSTTENGTFAEATVTASDKNNYIKSDEVFFRIRYNVPPKTNWYFFNSNCPIIYSNIRFKGYDETGLSRVVELTNNNINDYVGKTYWKSSSTGTFTEATITPSDVGKYIKPNDDRYLGNFGLLKSGSNYIGINYCNFEDIPGQTIRAVGTDIESCRIDKSRFINNTTSPNRTAITVSSKYRIRDCLIAGYSIAIRGITADTGIYYAGVLRRNVVVKLTNDNIEYYADKSYPMSSSSTGTFTAATITAGDVGKFVRIEYMNSIYPNKMIFYNNEICWKGVQNTTFFLNYETTYYENLSPDEKRISVDYVTSDGFLMTKSEIEQGSTGSNPSGNDLVKTFTADDFNAIFWDTTYSL